MQSGLFYFHSGWRYVVLLVLVVAIVKMIIGWVGKQSWSPWDRRLGVITPIVIDVQWLLGILLWLLAPSAWFAARNATLAEHLFTMTIALIAAHIGWARAKKAGVDAGKFRNAAVGFLVAGLLVGAGVAPHYRSHLIMDGLSQGFLAAHGIWRYLVLLTGFLAIVNCLMGWLNNREWRPIDHRVVRLFLSAIDIEVLLGLLLWALQARWDGADVLRSWRHPLLMLMAAAVVHYGWWRARRLPFERARFALATLYFFIGGLVIVIGILQIQGAL